MKRYFSYRILRGVKNRFGSTNEIGMFEMQREGMCEVILISESEDKAGSIIVATMEGTRPLLIEIQSINNTKCIWLSKRTANGIGLQ